MNSTTDQKVDKLWHCSICNDIFQNPRATDVCPNCNSEYIHQVGAGCEEMSSRDWLSDSTGSY